MPTRSSNKNRPADPAAVAREALLERQAAGLLLSIRTRLVLLALLIVLAPLFTDQVANAVKFVAICLGGVALMFYCRSLALKRVLLDRAGWLAVLFDLGLLSYAQLDQWMTLGSTADSMAVMAQTRVEDGLSFLLIVVNALALRPLFPGLVTAWTLLLDVVVLAGASALGVVWTLDRGSLGEGDLFAPTIIAREVGLVLAGLFLMWLARSARLAVHRVAELERAHAETRQRQAELIIEAKVGTLTSLVAGIAHEVHTPLGVLLSAISTAGSAAPKVTEAISAAESVDELRSNRRLEKVLEVMAETPKAANQAGQRIAKMVGTLKSFARLDEADVQRVDLREALDNALAVVEPELKRGVEVVRDYGEIPMVECRPREISQVFETILTNALEAMAGTGTLTLRADREGERVVVSIGDTGAGMSPAQLESLFDMGFDSGGERVKMSLGLPTGRVIVERMGGELSVESELGSGSVFRVELPLA